MQTTFVQPIYFIVVGTTVISRYKRTVTELRSKKAFIIIRLFEIFMSYYVEILLLLVHGLFYSLFYISLRYDY